MSEIYYLVEYEKAGEKQSEQVKANSPLNAVDTLLTRIDKEYAEGRGTSLRILAVTDCPDDICLKCGLPLHDNHGCVWFVPFEDVKIGVQPVPSDPRIANRPGADFNMEDWFNGTGKYDKSKRGS